jgi:hypothetical protein
MNYSEWVSTKGFWRYVLVDGMLCFGPLLCVALFLVEALRTGAMNVSIASLVVQLLTCSVAGVVWASAMWFAVIRRSRATN